MRKTLLAFAMLLGMATEVFAVDFNLAGNNTACFLELRNSSGEIVTADSSASLGTYNAKYFFKNVAEGTYTVVGLQKDSTMCGKLKFHLTNANQGETLNVVSVTVGISNTGWVMGTDWEADRLTLTDNNATERWCELGQSTTANRVSFIGLKGDTYVLTYKLSEARIAQGFVAPQSSASMTSGSNSTSVSAEQVGTYAVTVDSDINFTLGWKTGSPKAANGGTHFIPLNNVEPRVTNLDGGKKRLEFTLTDKYYYIYNASMAGKRSMKGFFCFYADTTGTNKVPSFNLTAADFGTTSPKNMITDVTKNSGSNVADIFMNINEKGFVEMAVGDTLDVFAQRNWQLINSIMNYYVDPDYHYTVINENGQVDNSVVTFDTTSTTWNPWVKMRAVGKGTAIVLVDYDACKTKIHTSSKGAVTTSDFYFNSEGGEWSALWPENTGVFVVRVGETASTVVTGMKNAEGLNVLTTGANKGKPTRYAAENVDAELDVFYFTGDNGYSYSFKPENAKKVEIAYPQIGAERTSFAGFAETGVSKAEDGTYTVILKHGTNIVRLQDEAGNYTYQVLRAKKASYEVINVTRPGSTPQAGDQLKVQYSGLYHPCNKLSGIYNMTGAIVYQGVANDNSIVGGSGQYNFGGTPAAQAFTITIPKTYDAASNDNKYSIGKGLLRSSGFGSAYGAHRYITRKTGATPNMNASVGTAYFGSLPEIVIATQQAKIYGVKFNVTPANAEVLVLNADGDTIKADADGYYKGIFGAYTYSVKAPGYKRLMNQKLVFTNTTADKQTIDVTLSALTSSDWDGVTKTQPNKNADGYYEINTGAELAWVASDVNAGHYTDSIVLKADISLGSYDWTPIGGTSASKAFAGECIGNGHTISDLYINSKANYVGLFAYATGNIKGLKVNGMVATTGTYAGGVAGAFAGVGYDDESKWRTISDCENHAEITAKNYAGGLVGMLTTGGEINRVWNDAAIKATNTSVSSGYVGGIVGQGNGFYTRIYNAYNLGSAEAMCYVGGIAGSYGTSAVIENCYNLGELKANSTNATYVKYCGAIDGSNTSNHANVKNVYASKAYTADMNATIVDAADFTSGRVAYLLGDAFGQEIGKDASPILGGKKVYFYSDTYSNTPDPAGVGVVGAEDAEIVSVITVDGRRTSVLQKGLNLVIMSDGSVRKVYVK